ncbi:MAG: transglycosylase SLT domain-containing protein [Proteobacteria bacterium]|nr:transglycosylase SLT domain-containing protein [Pseudomonadota bacterium]
MEIENLEGNDVVSEDLLPMYEDDEVEFSFVASVLGMLESENDRCEKSDGITEKRVYPEAIETNTDFPKKDEVVQNMPVYTNKRIEAFIRMYTHRKRHVFVQAINRSAKYMSMIHRIFKEHGLPKDLAYLAVVESNFNPIARSSANAVGMWQFMSYTGKIFGLQRSWWHDERYDPEKSTVAAAKFLKQLYIQFDGRWELALAAYNSGGGTVRRAIRRAKKRGKSADYWSLRLPRETRGYVPAFFAVVAIFNDLEGYGFPQAPTWEDEIATKSLPVSGGISLKKIAEALDIDHQLLVKMNPSLRLRGLTPATYDTFEITIPQTVQITQRQSDDLEELKKHRHKTWKIHRVRQGETLWSISRYYRIPVRKILAFNRLRRKHLINIGQKLMLPVPNNWTPPVVHSKTKLAKLALDKLPGITHIHKVKKGETLWHISTMYNIPIRTIKYWNRRILRRKYLRAGTELVLKLPTVPTGTST